MFRHHGQSRTYLHNIQLASLLSLVAGMVNVSGIFAVYRLTTNVTGHFAFFADEVSRENYAQAWVYLGFILAFFAGAFFSSFLSELIALRNSRLVTAMPVLVEIGLLVAAGLTGPYLVPGQPNVLAGILLFAMGLQNALVTRLSNAVVRTTHLTGLFTDLGIELAQLFFFRKPGQQSKLLASVKLRFTIIGFFFMGCVAGGFIYFGIGLKTLVVAAGLLLAGLIADTVKYRLFRLKRKLRR